jgi:antitoxin HicB
MTTTATKMPTRPVEEYLKLPYTIEVVRDKGADYTGWFARVLELPGCMTQADTFAEVDEMIQDAMRAWIETALAQNMMIPEPRNEEFYSGKFVVRVPRSLHKDLVEAAERNGVSLNTFVNVALAQVVGTQTNLKSSETAGLPTRQPQPTI